MVKAVFLDFYGTVVYEDDAVIEVIVERIFRSGKATCKSDIGAFWWNVFSEMFLNSFGITFKTQRELEHCSLVETIEHFQSNENVVELSNLMFEYWMKPQIFNDSKVFFKCCPVPIYIVSNIDRADIIKAINFHGLCPDAVFTSEDARSYKPRREIFDLALNNCGLSPQEVLHIGDSIKSDINGACALGINGIWLNRVAKNVPDNIFAVSSLLEVLDTQYFE